MISKPGGVLGQEHLIVFMDQFNELFTSAQVELATLLATELLKLIETPVLVSTQEMKDPTNPNKLKSTLRAFCGRCPGIEIIYEPLAGSSKLRTNGSFYPLLKEVLASLVMQGHAILVKCNDREFGKFLAIELCTACIQAGVEGLHYLHIKLVGNGTES